MTGHASSHAASPRRSAGGLPVPDLVAGGLALVAFILAFLPWLGLDCSGLVPTESAACSKVTSSGWQLPAGTAGTVLLVIAGVLVLARYVDAAAARTPAVAASLAALGTVLIVIQLAQGPPARSA